MEYDFLALGGGNAGLAAATRVARAGKKVALIDPTPIGGLCSLKGCNPKKVLVRATEVLQEVRDAAEHGIEKTEAVQINWSAVIDRKDRFTDPVTPHTEQMLKHAGVDYLKAEPHFVAPDRLEADGRSLSFDGTVIATGSTPRRLIFPGAEYVMTSDDLLEQRHIPQTLAIIGAGVVAFEFGQLFARLGSRVHILMHGAKALSKFDQELVAKLVDYSKTRLGMVFHESTDVVGIEREGGAYTIALNNRQTLKADLILNAAGRPANVEALNLTAAGVQYSSRGVVVDDYLRSPHNARVFAAGDAQGVMELSPVASYEGRIVAANYLEGDRERLDLSAIPSVVFTVPPLATVGLTEEAARSQTDAIDIVTEDMSGWKVFAIAGRKPAFGKLIADKATGHLLGVHLFGPGADENINLFALAMRLGATTKQLRRMIYAYPTYASALNYLVPSTV